jgi:hypothetical protein
MSSSHATTTCPRCGGRGQVPHAPGHYRVEVRYQDGRDTFDFPADQHHAAWAKARRIAKGDPSTIVAVIAPDGRIRSLDGGGRAVS